MSSATLLSSAAGVFRRKLWLPALLFFVDLFAMPIYLAMRLQDYLDPARGYRDPLLRAADFVEEFFSMANLAVILPLLCAAFFAAVLCFSYLHDRRQVDFYHSQPVRRERLFAEHFLAAAAAVLLPYLANLLLSLIVTIAMGCGAYLSCGLVLSGLGAHFLFTLVILAMGALAAVLSGNGLVHALVSLVLLGFGPALVGIYQWLRGALQPAWYSYLTDWETLLARSSPAARYLSLSGTTYGRPGAYSLGIGEALLTVLLLAVLLACALLLYRRRPSEAAGRALAFPVSRPVLKYPLMLLAMALFAMTLHEIGDNQNFVWYYVGAVLGGFLAAQIMEIIYRFDFHAISRKLLPMLLAIAVFCGVSLLLEKDVFGYNTYVPQQGVVAADVQFMSSRLFDHEDYLGVSSALLDVSAGDNLRRGHCEDPAAVAAAISLANKLAIPKTPGETADVIYDERGRTLTVSAAIRFYLENGRTVTRNYQGYVDLRAAREEIAALYSDPVFLDSQYVLFRHDPAQVRLSEVYSYEDATISYYYDEGVASPDDLARNERMNMDTGELLRVYRAELLAIPAELRFSEAPIGQLSFYLFERDPGALSLEWTRSDSYYYGNSARLGYRVFEYPLYSTMTETLALLETLGYDAAFWQFQPDQAVRAEIYHYAMDSKEVAVDALASDAYHYPQTREQSRSIVTDPAEIAALAAATVPAAALDRGLIAYNGNTEVAIIYEDTLGNTNYQYRYYPIYP